MFEMAVVCAILVQPAYGLVRLWAAKTLATHQAGPLRSVAEIAAVLA